MTSPFCSHSHTVERMTDDECIPMTVLHMTSRMTHLTSEAVGFVLRIAYTDGASCLRDGTNRPVVQKHICSWL